MSKISDLPDAGAITADDYLVIVDAPGSTPATRRVTASDAKAYFDSGNHLPAGYIDGGMFLDPTKAELWIVGTNPPPQGSDSTADWQALFDYAATMVNQGGRDLGGVTILIPRGMYVIFGTVTIPNMAGKQMVVDATGCNILHRPQPVEGVYTGVPMFRTALPTDQNDAEVQNDFRNMWTWRGGYYGGRDYAGEIAFEWNCVSRMVMERVMIVGFETGIRGRFVLHFKLRDSEFNQNSKYQVHIQADGSATAWTGATPGNAGSNGILIENCRFYGSATEIAQVYIASSAHTIRDCTFEGAGPTGFDPLTGIGGYNVMFSNGNNSVLGSSCTNIWFENNPSTAHVYVQTAHQYELDVQHAVSNPIADVRQCGLLKVFRMPWAHQMKLNGGTVLNGQNTGVNMVFFYSGGSGNFDLNNSAYWVGGVRPAGCTVYGPTKLQTIHYNGAVSQLTFPSGIYNVGDTIPVVWTVIDKLADGIGVPTVPATGVDPAITGTPTVGQTLTSTTGTWFADPSPPTYAYQWRRGSTDIGGATSSTYLLMSADLGAVMTCRVTATNTAGSGTATSNKLGPVT